MESLVKQQLPPSPALALPFLGHLHLLGKLPHQSLHKLARQYGDYMYLKLGKVNALVVSSPDSAHQVLKAKDHIFCARPDTTFTQEVGYKGAGVSFANGEDWKKTRKFCTFEMLTAKRVAMFRPVRKKEVAIVLKELLEHSESQSAVDISTKTSDLTFNIISTMITGKSFSASTADAEEKDQCMLLKKKLEEATVMAGFHAGDYLPIPKWMDTQVEKIRRIQHVLDGVLQNEIDEHKKSYKEGVITDFIDVMMSTNGLTDTNMKALIVDMVGGGTESSAVTVEWALSELLKNPKLMKKAQQELRETIGTERTFQEEDIPKLPYLQAVIKETFRLHPPGPLLIPHESTEETRLGDYTIPEKTRTVVNIYAIGRDPSAWEDPLRFDPERFLADNAPDVTGQSFSYLPFGSGRRICPGLLLAMATVQFILGSLLHAFDWELPKGQSRDDLDMTESFGLTVPRASPLVLVPTARLQARAYHL